MAQKRKMYVFESDGGFGNKVMRTIAATEGDAATHAARQQFGQAAYARKSRPGVYITGTRGGSSSLIKLADNDPMACDAGAMVAEYQQKTGCDWTTALVACNCD
ncbi:MAG: hypothetical protein ACYCOU_01805 [Sulfobacillus sp.]